jgi:hypothetical protein
MPSCRQTRSVAWGRSFFVVDAKLMALSRCAEFAPSAIAFRGIDYALKPHRTGADQHNRRLAVPTTVTASPAGPLPQKNVNRIFYLIRATLRGILGR